MTKQNKRQAIGPILPPRLTNSWKFLKPNKSKGLLSFWEVKILGWFTNTGYEKTQKSVVSDMALYYAQYKHTKSR